MIYLIDSSVMCILFPIFRSMNKKSKPCSTWPYIFYDWEALSFLLESMQFFDYYSLLWLTLCDVVWFLLRGRFSHSQSYSHCLSVRFLGYLRFLPKLSFQSSSCLFSPCYSCKSNIWDFLLMVSSFLGHWNASEKSISTGSNLMSFFASQFISMHQNWG